MFTVYRKRFSEERCLSTSGLAQTPGLTRAAGEGLSLLVSCHSVKGRYPSSCDIHSAISDVRFTCAPCKGGAFQWVQAPPGNRSSRKQPEQSWR
jgi:hypothetical protein